VSQVPSQTYISSEYYDGMFRGQCSPMILCALRVLSVPAQSQSTWQSKGRVAFTVREAPENLACEIFFGGLECLRHLAYDRNGIVIRYYQNTGSSDWHMPDLRIR
jgi:hypothetical protein